MNKEVVKMICKSCGHEMEEGLSFCPNCGKPINVEATVKVLPKTTKTTFGSAIVALFTKMFVFKGKSKRLEFNFGLLFIYIISVAISTILIVPEMTKIMSSINFENFDPETYVIMLESFLLSIDPLSAINLASIIVCLVYAVFLTAPVYRRIYDAFDSKVAAIILSIVFALGQVLGSPIMYFAGVEVYNVLSPILSLVSLASTVVLGMSIFVKSKYYF